MYNSFPQDLDFEITTKIYVYITKALWRV